MSERSRLSRRFPGPVPDGLDKGGLDQQTGAALKRLLKNLVAATFGVPGGFKDTPPITVIVGTEDDADAGTESASWMAADAQLIVQSDAPSGLANTNVEGTALTVSRADHQHKRDVRVMSAGSDVGTRNAISFSAAFTVTDNPGSDRVDVDVAGLSPVDLEFLAWVL